MESPPATPTMPTAVPTHATASPMSMATLSPTTTGSSPPWHASPPALEAHPSFRGVDAFAGAGAGTEDEDDLRERSQSWSSVRSLLRRVRSSSMASTGSSSPETTFYLWDLLPVSVRFHCVEFLSVSDFMNISLVSRAACSFARSDILWRTPFRSRFRSCEGAELVTSRFMEEYRSRILDPQVGDTVEVLWQGSFNLIADDTVTSYEGSAWWSAKVVAHSPEAYKIHYPQWDSDVWDEWVPRDRIRWPPYAVDYEAPLHKGDIVEHQCTSSHGQPPWLECRVVGVQNGMYYLGDVIRSGNRWVPRDTLRLVAAKPSFRSHVHAVMKLTKCSIM